MTMELVRLPITYTPSPTKADGAKALAVQLASGVVGYLACVDGGPVDAALVNEDGVISLVVNSAKAIDAFQNYPEGPINTLTLGYNFDGASAHTSSEFRPFDQFDGYPEGTVTTLTLGYEFGEGTLLAGESVTFDDFESYPEGAFQPLNSGSGWLGLGARWLGLGDTLI
jgi:hypothetical protein